MKLTVGLIVALLVAGPVHDLFPDPASAALIAAVLAAVVVGIGICTAIALGKRRAVSIYVVLVVGGLFQLALSATVLHSNFADFVWNATLRATAAAAIVLLFSQSARSWFAVADERPVLFDPDTGRRL